MYIPIPILYIDKYTCYKIWKYSSISLEMGHIAKGMCCLHCSTVLTISRLQQSYIVLLSTVSAIKRNQLLLEWHCRLKALQVHAQFCSREVMLSCKWGMMQKMDETEFKEQ